MIDGNRRPTERFTAWQALNRIQSIADGDSGDDMEPSGSEYA